MRFYFANISANPAKPWLGKATPRLTPEWASGITSLEVQREGIFQVSLIQRYSKIVKALDLFCFFSSSFVWPASYRAAVSSQQLSQSQAASVASRKQRGDLLSEEQRTLFSRQPQHVLTGALMECRAHPWTGTCGQGAKVSQAWATRHLLEPEAGISTP